MISQTSRLLCLLLSTDHFPSFGAENTNNRSELKSNQSTLLGETWTLNLNSHLRIFFKRQLQDLGRERKTKLSITVSFTWVSDPPAFSSTFPSCLGSGERVGLQWEPPRVTQRLPCNRPLISSCFLLSEGWDLNKSVPRPLADLTYHNSTLFDPLPHPVCPWDSGQGLLHETWRSW